MKRQEVYYRLLTKYAAETGSNDDRLLILGVAVANYPILERWVQRYRADDMDTCDVIGSTDDFKLALILLIEEVKERVAVSKEVRHGS